MDCSINFPTSSPHIVTEESNREEKKGHILKVANGGNATKTKIMYRAFLSYNQLKEQLMFLTENELLSYDKLTQTFKTTEKGLRLLDTYNQMDDMIK